MAGFFSLGSLSQDPTTNTNPTESTTCFLYSTTTNSRDHRPTTTTTTTTRRDFQPQNLLAMGGGDGRFINFSDESTWGSAGLVMMGHGVSGSGGGGGGGGVCCQDCGNQAKKDCPHFRCRTCCKSRGFQCQTHVKSTWVPAAKRRERQQYNLPATQQDHNRSCHLVPNTKRTRSVQDPGNPNLGNPISVGAYNSSSTGLEVGNFPSEVTRQVDFRCVRVSSIDETDDQFAYQGAVNIGGHLFKGILYDQGPDQDPNMGGDTSSGGSAGVPQLNLSPGDSSNFIGHSLYTSLGGNDYMNSTQFFHQISRD